MAGRKRATKGCASACGERPGANLWAEAILLVRGEREEREQRAHCLLYDGKKESLKPLFSKKKSCGHNRFHQFSSAQTALGGGDYQITYYYLESAQASEICNDSSIRGVAWLLFRSVGNQLGLFSFFLFYS